MTDNAVTTGGRRSPASRLGHVVISALLALVAMPLVVALTPSGTADAFPPAIFLTYVPFDEDDVLAASQAIRPTSTLGNVVTTINVTAAADNTLLYYDHWEDGYEADIANPVQTTTEVWGDGDVSNGAPPGVTVDANDIVDGGDNIFIQNTVPMPRTVSDPPTAGQIFFDGADKIGGTRGFSATRAAWTTGLGTILAGAVAMSDTSRFGTRFDLPVGEDLGLAAFEYTSASVQASRDGTLVEVDTDGNGVVDLTANLDEGQTYFVNGGLDSGAIITTSRPAAVSLFTGDINASFESRWFEVFPAEIRGDEYIAPVGTTVAGQPTSLFLQNPNNSFITVAIETTVGTVNQLILPGDVFVYDLPTASGARVTSSDGTFNALSATVANGGSTATYDWGYGLLTRDQLSSGVVIGWGAGAPVNATYSPIWVSPVADTTISVDRDGDGIVDETIAAIAYQSVRISDPDNDLSGARIFAADGTLLAVAWGQDPDGADANNAYDLGTAIIPISSLIATKDVDLEIDNDGNGLPSPGDVLKWTVTATDAGAIALTNVNITDELPATVTYVEDSTTLQLPGGPENALPDDVVGTPYPVDGTGLDIAVVPQGDQVIVTYLTTIIDPFPPLQTQVRNDVVITSDQGDASDTAIINLSVPNLSVQKSVSPQTPVLPGDTITYTITAANNGSTEATGVEVLDTLPAEVNFVSGSRTNPIDDIAIIAEETWSPAVYTNNTGTGWLGSWDEDENGGADNGPANGRVQIVTDLSDNRIRFNGVSRSIQREFEGSAYDNAELSYDFRRVSMETTNDGLLEISFDGSIYFELDRMLGNGTTDGAYLTSTIDLTPFLGQDFFLRWSSNDTFADNGADSLFIDNIQITALDRVDDTNPITAGDLPTLWTGGDLQPGEVATMTLVATVDDPIDVTVDDFANVASITSTEVPIPETDDAVVEVARARVGDFVWDDTNGDGVFDVGEPGLDGVTVNLLDDGGNVIATTTTAGGGLYEFDDIDPNVTGENYTVQIVPPTGFVITSDRDGNNDGNVDQVLDFADDITDIDFGLTALVSVGDLVFSDLDGDGIYEPGDGDTPIAGIDVTITGPSFPGGQTVQTDANGIYGFTGLLPGAYTVTVDDSVLPTDADSTTGGSTQNVTLVSGTDRDDVDFGYDDAIFEFALTLAKSDGDVDAVPGSPLTYTISWANTDEGPATGVVVSDVVPANTRFESTGSDPGWSCSDNDPAGTTCTLTVGTVAGGGSGSAAFVVVPLDPFPAGVTSLSNTASITDDGTEPGTLPSNATEPTPVDAAPDLVLVKDAPEGPLSPGDTFTYTVTVRNDGNQDDTSAIFTDTPGANTTLVAGSVTVVPAAAGTVTSGNGTSPDDTDVAVDLGTLSGGESVTITFDVVLDSTFASASNTVTNQGELTAASLPTGPLLSDDPDEPGTTDPTPTIVNAAPILSATKVDAFTAPLTPGDTIDYTITIDNAATATTAATGVVFDDAVPAGTTLVAGSLVATGSTAIVSGSLATDTTVEVDVGSIPIGASRTITFSVVVDDPVAAGLTEISNQGIVESNELPDVPTDDPTPGGPDDPTTTPLTAAFDLRVTKSDNTVTTVSPGDTIAYTISVINDGDQAAASWTLTDTLPAGTTFDAAGSTTGWSCAGTVCTFDSSGALAGGGASIDVTFAVTVDDPATSGRTSIDNVVTVSSPGETNTANNDASESTPLAAAPILTITKSDGVGGTIAGANDEYIIRVTNTSAADQVASGIVVTETVPVGTTFDAANSDLWTGCADGAAAGTSCTFTIATLAPGAAVNISFAVDVDDPVASGVDEIVNTAAITAEDNLLVGDLPAPVTDTNILTAAPDLTVAKTDGGASVAPGGTVAYAITVTNLGDQASSGSTLTETVPANSTFVAGASTAGWSCADGAAAGTTCTLSIGAIAGDGGTATATFAVAAVDPIPAGVTELSNAATIADNGANGADSDPTNDDDATDTTPIVGAPDLTIVKDDSLTNVAPGDTVVYTITVDNVGNRGAENVTVTDVVPANTTFDEAGSTAGWSCSDNAAAGTSCTFDLGTVEVGDAADVITFAVTIDDAVPSGTTALANTASVADDGNNGTDPTPGDNSNGDTDTLDAVPDLAVDKTDADVTVAVGNNIAYSIEVSNVGNEGSAGSTLTDVVPANTTFDPGSTTAGWACAPDNSAGSTCTLTLGPIAAGSSTTVDFVVTVDATVPTGVTQISNSATVTDNGANGADPNGANDTEGEATPVTAAPALVATKVDAFPGATLTPGEVITYTVTIDNAAGTTGATNVEFTDAVPANTTIVAGSLTVPGGATINDGDTAGDTNIDVSLGTIPAGQNRVITFQVTVDDPVSSGVTEISNQGTVTADGPINVPTDDPTPPGGNDPTTTPLATTYDLEITKTDSGASLNAPSGVVVYDIAVTASGDVAAAGVTITETVPVGTVFDAAASDSWTGCGDGAVAGTVCTLDLGTLDDTSGTQNVDFAVRLVAPVAAGLSATTNTATVDSDDANGAESDETNNSDDEPTPIVASPDLVIAKTDDVAAATTPGALVTYTISVDNVGTQDAADVTVSETVPVGTTFDLAGSSAGWVGCADDAAAGTSCTFDLGAIAAGGSAADITFAVTVDSPLAAGIDSLSNTASVSDVSGEDATPGDNSDDETTPVTAAPALTITKSDGDVTTTPGTPVTYTITWANGGDQDAAGVVITDVVPANSTFTEVGSDAGWSCSTGDPAGTSCTLSVGAVAAGTGGSATYTVIPVDPFPAGVTQLTNSATLVDDGNNGGTPPGPATDTTPVTAAPIIDVTKTDSIALASTVEPGDTITYTITITNSGDQVATGLNLTDIVPADTTLVLASVTAPIGSTDNSVGNTVDVDLPDLGTAAPYTVTFDVVVDNPLAAGVTSVANQATVAATGLTDVDSDDPETGAVDDPTVTNIDAAPAFTISKSDGGATVTPGDTVTYTIDYANTGNQDATGVVITETVPTGSTFVAAAINPWSCSTGDTGTCTISALSIPAAGPGSSNSVAFTVRADDPFPAGQTDLANTVSITDGVVSGGPATDTTPVTASPDLSVSKNAVEGPVNPGATITYTVVITNSGDQDDSNVVFTDTPGANTTLVATTVTTDQGTVTTGNTAGDTDVVVDVGTLAGDGGTATITFDVVVDNPFPTPTGTVTNQGQVDSDDLAAPLPTDDPDEPGATDPTPTDVAASPDISAVKTASSVDAPVVPGSVISYSVVIRNDGTTAATNVDFADAPDANTSLVVGSVTATAGGTVDTGNTAGDTTVAVDLATLAVGEEITVTFDVTVNDPLPGGTTAVSNQGNVTADGPIDVPTDDPTPPGADDPTVTPITAAPIIESTKTDATSVDVDGRTRITYTVEITNAGNEEATNLEFVDTPGTFTSLDDTSVVVSPAVGSTVDTTGGVLTVDIASLAGQTGATPTTVTITFDVLVDERIPASVTSVSNQGNVTGDGGIDEPTDDPDTGADDDPTATPIDFAPDLVVTKTDGDTSVAWGGTVVYDVTYSNVGRQDATGVTITETIPTGTTFNAGASTAGWVCDPTSCVFTVGDVDAGDAPVTIDFAVDVPNPVTGGQTTVANSVSIADDGTNGADETPADNTDTDSTPILTPPALTIDKVGPSQAPPTLIEPGDTVTYTLGWENTGETAATAVEIVDTVPTGMTFVAAGSDAGWSCSDGDIAGTDCTLTLGTVAAGATGSVTIVLEVVNPFSAASIANTATIDDDDAFGVDVVDDSSTFTVAITSGSIGDRIWIDADEDGVQDAGELGAPTGTVVQLRDQATGDVITTTTTGADGSYGFDGIPAGDYTITVVTPAGYTAPDGTSVDLTLAVGENNDAIDIPINQRGSIGDAVVFDANDNGVIDGTETTGPSGVTVELFDAADLVTPIATTTTAAGGAYSFPNLLAGDYVVRVTPPTGFTVTTPNDLARTVTVDPATNDVTDADFGIYAPAAINGTVRIDADNSGSLEVGETDFVGGATINLLDENGDPVLDGLGAPITTTSSAVDGSYSFTGLLPGTYQTSITTPTPDDFTATTPANSGDIVLAVGDTSDDNDFGVFKPATIGDLVWYDVDGDGIKDADEPGIGGVTVTLTLPDASTTTATTLPDGSYDFTGLLPGSYLVEITAGLPTDADINPAAPIAVNIGVGDDENDADFSITGNSTIGDTVYFDENVDGIQQPGETTGVAGVTVQLLLDGIVVDTTVSDSNGNYSFDDLLADDYTVSVGATPSGTSVTTPVPIAVTLPANDTVDTADIGIAGTGSIGDVVFLDLDEDGTQLGVGEVGVNGVVVTLSDDAGNVVATTTTTTLGGIPGSYSFDNLPAGDYEVTVDTTAVDNDTPYSVTTDGAAGNPFVVSLGDGLAGNDNTIDTVDIGINALGTISGLLFVDADEDGIQSGPLEVPQGGVTVSLLDAAGDPVDLGAGPITTTTSTTAGSIGEYTFTDLPAGEYQVRIGTLPAGYTLVAATPNDADVSLAAGEDEVDVDFGINNRSTISGQVFVDPNEDGVKQAGEGANGLESVTLNLLDGAGAPVLDGAGDPVTATTDTDGNYSFPNLPAGTYRVEFDDTTLPADYDATSAPTTTDIVIEVDDDEIDVDFGANKRGSIGDTLFYDLDGDGIQNGAEPGLAGIDVALLDDLGAPVLDGAGDPVTTTTDANGNYSFGDLLADDYQVEIDVTDLPANAVFTTAGDENQSTTVPVAATPTTDVTVDDVDFGVRGNASLGDTVFVDLDADGTQDPGETTGVVGVDVQLVYDGVVIDTATTGVGGTYSFDNLLAGTHGVQIDASTLPAGAGVSTTTPLNRTLAAGDDIDDADIGIAGTGSIGDKVWYDADADGLDNNGEDGLGGIVVILSDGAGNEISRDTTDANGAYLFDNLPAGTYVVTIDPTSVPAGGIVNVPPPATPIVLGDGLAGNDNTIDDIDIGITGTRSIGDTVFYDTNGDGVDDIAETDGVGGVTLELLDGVGPTATVLATTVTAADGSYSFDNVFADTFFVRVVGSSLPAGTALTTSGTATADTTVASVTDADFGVTGTNSIGDLVFFDADGDDARDANEPGLGGVVLRLLDSVGNPVQIDGVDVTAATDADGLYSFDRIPAGTYSVEVVSGLPTGATADNLGTATVTLTDGDAIDTQDFAVNGDSSIGDVVFLDADENEAQSGALEVGQNGIDVVLFDAGGNELDRATTATLATVPGSYLFDGLIPGTYRVAVDETTLPTTDWFVTTDPATVTVALPAATDDLDNDFGITARGSIGDQVWVDANGNGVRDAGEVDYTGSPITLALLDGAGAPILDGAGDPVTTTTSAVDGTYLFDDLPVGDYQVQLVTGTLPTNFDVVTVLQPNPRPVSVTPAGARTDIDFGVNAPGSISGEVFADVNEDGTQQPTETAGVQGATLTLLDTAGDPVLDGAGDPITAVTGPDGSYSFPDVPAGDYQVEVTSLPTGYTLTTPANSGTISVAVDTDTPNIDFGANFPGTIGDLVFYDVDGDGIQGAGEPGLGGITVELVDDGGTVIDTQITGTDGSYDFTDVNAGDYTVRLAGVPANTVVTTPTGGVAAITLALGGDDNTADFGLRGSGSVGDTVFIDANGDGVQSGPLDVGQPNVELILSVDAAGDGTFVEIARTTSTTAAGVYDFTDLLAADYQVTVNPLTIPAGYSLTTTDPLPATVGDGTAGNPADIDTADVGITALGTITGTAFIDADENGTQDLSGGSVEAGQAGVVVELRDAAGDPVLDGTGSPITETTDANGDYTFTDVPGGDYTVRVVQPIAPSPLADFDLVTPNDLTVSLPVGGSVADVDFGFNNRGSIGDRIWIDSNGDQVQDGGETNAGGSITVRLLDPNNGNAEITSLVTTDGTYDFPNLLPGDYVVRIDTTTLPAGFNLTTPNDRAVTVPVGDDSVANVDTADFGINSLGVIGDVVFYDANGDGVQQAGEPGVDGVTVTLTPAAGTPVDVVTSGGGTYSFTNLLAGDYTVSVSNLPAGSVLTAPTANGGTFPITLGVGDAVDTADFGLTGVNTIGDRVFFDTNGDGDQTGDAQGVGGVDLSLIDNTGPTPVVVATTTTLADGSYSFDNIVDGTYEVVVDPNTLPTGTTVTTPDPLTGQTVVATVTPGGPIGQVIDTADIGITGVNSIGDRIWFDVNDNGLQDAGEPGVAGVQIRLLDGGGNEVRPAQSTDANGNYDFTNLPDGTYTVDVVSGIPADGVSTPVSSLTVTVDSTDGTPDDVDDRDIAVTGASSLGDQVFVDPNADGVQQTGVAGQPDETVGVAGVTVELLIDSGAGPVVAATTVTGPDGAYSFPNLLAGDYTVRTANLPTGTVGTSGDLTVTVPANTAVDTADLGVAGVGSIGDTVYLDIDSDQSQDTSVGSLEVGQENIVVILTDDAGNEIARTTSGADGAYSFPNVIPGDYTVTIDAGTLPTAGYQVTTVDPLGVTVGDGTGSDPADVTDADIGINALGVINGKVFTDADEDGVQAGPLEVDQAGVTVILRDSDGDEVARTDTLADGSYSFDDLVAGDYTIDVDPNTLPAGYSVATPAPDPITLAIGETSDDNDVGINARGSIGDRVWIDLNNDGVQDADETDGLAGVVVNLVDRVTGDPVLDDGGNAITDTTDANGEYLFANVLPGDYSVQLDVTSLPAGYTPTTATSIDDVLDLDEDNADVDFGVNAQGTISGTVYFDLDASTTQNGGEPGLDGIDVELVDADGNVVATVPTGADGSYTFTGVNVGDYTVRPVVATLPAGAIFTTPASDAVRVDLGDTVTDVDFGVNGPGTIGDTVFLDADGNGVQDTTAGSIEDGLTGLVVILRDDAGNEIARDTTDANGTYGFSGLFGGDYTIEIDPASVPVGNIFTTDGSAANPFAVTLADSGVGATVDTADIGLNNPSSISGTLFVDADSSGDIDVTETDVLAGVTVELLDDDGNVIDTTVTQADGSYVFTDVPAGDFTVRLDTADLAAVHPGYSATLPDSIDVTVGVNDDQTGLDFGANNPSDLAGSVWVDVDNDDIRDAGETAVVPDVTDIEIVLLDSTGTEIDRVNLDANGDFLFTDVPAGDYTIEVDETTLPDTPVSYNLTAPNGESIVLGVDDDRTGIEFGVNAIGVIGDTVWFDVDGDGIEDADETYGIEGIDVVLFDSGGVEIDRVQTNSDGEYRFLAVNAGSYTVGVDLASRPDLTITSIAPVPVTLGVGEAFLDADIGVQGSATIGDTVFFDVNGDGIEDAGDDVGLGGVTLILRDADGDEVDRIDVPADGSYSFTNLPAGDYTIEVDPLTVPTGYTLTTDGSVATPISVTVADGTVIDTADIGLTATGTVGDTVFVDANGNGVQDPGEAGQGGVDVVLLDGGVEVDRVTTGADGSYVFTDVNVGDYTVTIDPTTLPDPSYTVTTVDPAPVTVGPNDVIDTIDVGINTLGSVSGVVFVDIDGDGERDPIEPGQPGVDVVLFDSDGNEVDRVTVQPDGTYTFPDVLTGDYVVRVDPATLPTGSVLTTPSDVPVSVPLGGDVAADDIGVAFPGTVGGVVFVDPDRDGVREPGDTGFPGVTVVLVDDDGNTVATTSSGPDGSYSFPDVVPGDYTVEVFPTRVDATGPTVVAIDVESGEDVTDVDFGVIEPAELSGNVFYDSDVSGAFDADESGFEGVTVLLRDVDGTVIATTTVGPDGAYSFTAFPGVYTVEIDERTVPAGHRVTTPTSGSVTLESTGTAGPDFGVVGTASIGDVVFGDTNGNGVQDGSEVGLANVRLTLLDSDGNVLAVTTTGPGGIYGFTDLRPGDYTVRVDTTSLPNGFVLSGSADIPVTLAAGDNDLSIDIPLVAAGNPFIPTTGNESGGLLRIAAALLFLGLFVWSISRRRKDDDGSAHRPAPTL